MKLKILIHMLLTSLCLVPAVVRAESSAPTLQAQPILIAESSWREWVSSQGKFAILMPDKPTEETQKDQDGSVNYYFKYQSEKDVYFVMYTDIPNITQISSEKVKQILDRVPIDFVKGADAKLLSQKSISLNGHPGREFEFAFTGGIPGKGRVYLVDQRLYVAIAATPQQEDAQKFLTSFRLTTK